MGRDSFYDEQERIRHHVKQMFSECLHTGTAHPTIAYATRKPGNHEQGTAYASRSAAAGGNHEYKD